MLHAQEPLKLHLPQRWMVLLVPFLKILGNPRMGSRIPILPIIFLFPPLQILEKLRRLTSFRLILQRKPPNGKRRAKSNPNPMPQIQSLLNLVSMMVPNVNRSTPALSVKETIIPKIVLNDFKLVNFSKSPKGLWKFLKNRSRLSRPRWLNNRHHLHHLGPRSL